MPYSPDPAQILLHNPQDYDYIVDPQSFPSQPAAAQAHMIQFREQARDESVQLPESFERGARVKGRMDNYWRNRVMKVAGDFTGLNFAVANKDDFQGELSE